MKVSEPTSMHFLFILIVILLETLPVQNETKFWLEFTVDDRIRARIGHHESRNLLFDCANDLRHPIPKGTKAPIRCTLVKDRSKKDQIYMSKNFFVVWKPKLPRDQKIEFYPTPIKGLPESLFVAVSYEPLNYPDFVEQGKDVVFGRKPSEPELDEIHTYHKISNLNYLRENFEKIRPGFLLYQKYLREETAYYWLLFFVDDETGSPQRQEVQKEVSAEVRKKVPKKLMAQISHSTPESVYDEIAEPIVGLLTKMIDPCFIATLVNSKEQVRISSKEASDYCKNFCRFLAVAPLVLRKEVAVQCHDLNVGKCDGNTCLCAQSQSVFDSGYSVTMAECNNRVVSVSGTGQVHRFSSPFQIEQERQKRKEIEEQLQAYVPPKASRMSRLLYATRTCGGLIKRKPYYKRKSWLSFVAPKSDSKKDEHKVSR